MDPTLHCRPERVRELADDSEPIFWSEKWRAWFVTGYQESLTVLKDQRFSVKYNEHKRINTQHLDTEALALLREFYCGGMTQFTFSGGRSLLVMDGSEHSDYRRLVMRHFTSREAIKLTPRIHKIVDDLLSEWEGKEQVELMNGFAYKIPILLFGDILGIPEHLRKSFIDYSAFTESRAAKSQFATTEDMRKVAAQGPDFLKKIDTIIDEKSRCPADDMVSTLLAGKVNGDSVGKDTLRAMIYMLNTASQTTTTALIGNSVYQFLRFGIWTKLAQNLEIVPAAIEEVLRFDPPSSPYFGREVVDDIDFHGQRMKKGETVLIFVGAANRDPRQFPEPSVFREDRDPNRHLGFGSLGGSHFCLGAPFARQESLIAITELMKRYPRMSIVPEPERAKSFGFSKLNVKLG